MKECTKCRQLLPAECFTLDRQKKDGLRPSCKACVKLNRANQLLASRKWKALNPEKVRAGKRAHYWKDPEKARAANRADAAKHRARRALERRAAYAADPSKFTARNKTWADAHPEVKRRAKRSWKVRNPHRLRADRAARRARELQATPPWADRAMILAYYERCTLLNRIGTVRHHVDHIIPLRSKLVCGLHNEFNLQIIPAIANMAKSNRFTPG